MTATMTDGGRTGERGRRPGSTAPRLAVRAAAYCAAALLAHAAGLSAQVAAPASPASAPGSAAESASPAAAPESRPGLPATPGASARAAPVSIGYVAADDYRIGPQDLIEIQVFGIDNLKREVRVNSKGSISLPLIGTVVLGGLTGQEAEALIASMYEKDYLRDPQVSVFIKEFTSQRITVEGAVAKPGVYPIRGQTTLLQAIAIAGGQGQLPDLSQVMVYRRDGNEKKVLTFDLVKVRSGEVPDPSLVNEDIVVVRRDEGRVVLRDSIVGDFINIFNPLNYLPRY